MYIKNERIEHKDKMLISRWISYLQGKSDIFKT